MPLRTAIGPSQFTRAFSAGLGAIAFATACADSTAPGVPTTTLAPHVTASIAGSAWAANYQVDLAVGDLLENGTRAEIVGLEVGPSYAGRQVSLLLRDFRGVGTYALGPYTAGGSSAFYVESPDVRASGAVRAQQDVRYELQQAGAGAVQVTGYVPSSGRIEGAFTLDVATSAAPAAVVRITNGTFAGRIVRAQ